MMSNNNSRYKSAIVEVLTTAYTRRDFTAMEKWFSPDYIQHNPFIPSKREGLRDYIKNLPEGGGAMSPVYFSLREILS